METEMVVANKEQGQGLRARPSAFDATPGRRWPAGHGAGADAHIIAAARDSLLYIERLSGHYYLKEMHRSRNTTKNLALAIQGQSSRY